MIARLRRRLGGELGGYGKDSFYVATWQASSALADLAQIALVTRVLGITEYGRFAIATALVVLVSQLFDFRVGVVATTVGAQELERGTDRAAGTFQFSYFLDASTGFLGFLAALIAGVIFAPGLVGDNGVAIVLIYALAVLASTTDEASLAVLRLLDRYRLVATYTAVLEASRVAFVGLALLIDPSLVGVAIALLAHKLLYGLTGAVAAARVFRVRTSSSLWARGRAQLVRSRWGEMVRTILNTNLVSYARLAQSQLPALLLGALASAFEVGIYKLGMAAAALIGKLADPPYIAFLPRISRLWAAGGVEQLRSLTRTAAIAVTTVALIASLALILFRDPALFLLGGEDAEDAAGVLVLGTIGFAISTALFWNVGVLYAAGRVPFVARLSLITALLQAGLLYALISVDGAEGAALSFAISMAFFNLVATPSALRALRSPAGVAAV